MLAGDILTLGICTRGVICEEAGIAQIGAMPSLVSTPTAELRGSTEIREEFFFLQLFFGYTVDSASRAEAAPIETGLFGVKTRVENVGFYFGPVNSLTL